MSKKEKEFEDLSEEEKKRKVLGKPISEYTEIDFYKARVAKPGITSDELLKLEFPDPRWIVDAIIPEGLILLGGKPKTGKSWFALQIAAAVSMGLPVFGEYKTTKGKVIYLALEDNFRRLKRRFDLIKGFGSDSLLFFTEWERGLPGVKALERGLDDFPDTSLIVIDTLARFIPEDIDYNDFSPAHNIGSLIKQLSDMYSVSVIVITHTRKSGGEDFVDSILGSTGFTAATDATLVLTRGRGEADGYVRGTGRDFETDIDIALELVKDEGWKALGSGAEYRMSKTRRDIIDALRAEGAPMGPNEITAVVGLAYSYIRKLLPRMYSDGQVGRNGNGKYFYLEER